MYSISIHDTYNAGHCFGHRNSSEKAFLPTKIPETYVLVVVMGWRLEKCKQKGRNLRSMIRISVREKIKEGSIRERCFDFKRGEQYDTEVDMKKMNEQTMSVRLFQA